MNVNNAADTCITTPLQHTTPLRAIKEKCRDCSGGLAKEVKLCAITDCPLFAFRFGKNALIEKRHMTEEQKQTACKSLSQARLVRHMERQPTRTKTM